MQIDGGEPLISLGLALALALASALALGLAGGVCLVVVLGKEEVVASWLQTLFC